MVVFDLDGVLVESETLWDEARRAVTAAAGGTWAPRATTDMMGMSSLEWSRYLHERLGARDTAEELRARVDRRVLEALSGAIPWLPGAREAVARVAADGPVGIASSASRPVIDLVVARGGLERYVSAAVSSEEVARGKPAPDVYLEAARRLGVDPAEGVAVEDSTNGLRSAARAGFAVLALPNREHPPEPDAVALAAGVLGSLHELTVERLATVRARR